jgi:3-dehydroquinate dehydratase-2
MLGQRDPANYGTITLPEIEEEVKTRAIELGVSVEFFQANGEGELIDYLQKNAPESQGVIINPGGYTHYSLAIRDSLENFQVPIIEVHISNIFGREEFRRHSVTAEMAHGIIAGLGWNGYILALEYLASNVNDLSFDWR